MNMRTVVISGFVFAIIGSFAAMVGIAMSSWEHHWFMLALNLIFFVINFNFVKFWGKRLLDGDYS